MGDVFKEQMVKRIPSNKDTLIKTVLLVACFIIAILSLFFITHLIPVIILGLGFSVYYVFNMIRKEYEYILTNSELDIDCIYGKSKRKRKFSCDIKEVVVLAHHSRKDIMNEFSTAVETLDFSSGKQGEDTWYLLVVHNSKRVKVIIEPNEKMMNALKIYISPRKMYKKQ